MSDAGGRFELPFEVVDAHIHYFLASVLNDPAAWGRRYTPEQLRRMTSRFERNLAERGQPKIDHSMRSSGEYAEAWLRDFDANGISAGIFLTLDHDYASMEEFAALAPGRFIPFAHVDPLDPGAPASLADQVRRGARGLKLIATTQRFHPYDPFIYPLWEKAEELRLPVIVHSGVSIGYTADFRYANPLDLQPVLRDFPDLNILLAHFGTGFLREALLLCYQCPNLYLDTSSSNIWMKYQDHPLDLAGVFRQSLEAAGPERIVFGTDSSYFPRGFRADILRDQHRALASIGCPERDMALIFGGNIRRLLAAVR